MFSSPELWAEFFERYYWDQVNALAGRIADSQSDTPDDAPVLYVDVMKDLLFFMEGRLVEELFERPDVVIEHAEEGLRLTPNIHDVTIDGKVRFINLPPTRKIGIKDVRTRHVGKFVAIEGLVRKVTKVFSLVTAARFRCTSCGRIEEVVVEEMGKVPYPQSCRLCKSKGRSAFELVDSARVDFQRVEIQEYPENLRGGETPCTIQVFLREDLVGRMFPGNRVVVNGILRLDRKKALEEVYIDANSIELLEKEYEEIEITEEDERRIRELAQDPRVYEKVVNSIAPSIHGHEDIKLAVALQLFGGVPKELPDGTRLRGDIHILLVGDPGSAKCVDYDTEVLLSDGSVVKIGDLVNSRLKNGMVEIDDGVYAEARLNVISLDSRELKARSSVANIVWKRQAPGIMYEITTKTGRKIRVTPTHPFFTIRDGKFITVKAEDLKKGELIATPRKLPVFGSPQPVPRNFERSKSNNAVRLKLPEKTSPEFWRFVALFIAEGYAQNRGGSATVFFTNIDEKLLSEFFDYAKSLGLNPSIRKPHKDRKTKEVVIPSVELYKFLELLGAIGESKDKRVPCLLFRCSKEEIRAFLSAFFDAEASVIKAEISVVSASEKLLRQIQHLLLRFGIISQLHKTQSRATNSPNSRKKIYYRLRISGDNIARFAREIGFTTDKALKLKNLVELRRKRKRNPNLDVIPGISSVLRETRRLLGLTQFECGIKRTTYQHLERGDRRPSRDTLRRVVSTFKGRAGQSKDILINYNLRLLELLAESDIFWDEIAEINTYRPAHSYVYDLQVLEHHNFVANDIFIHNSQILRFVKNVAPRSVYASGKGTTTAGITAAVTRDEFDGRWTLEAGVLVLADRGIALVDEIDKMSREDRDALHTALEQQIVSINKAGINATLRSRCALLAAANPKYGRFDRYTPIPEQIDLDPALLSRFDLIFVVVDVPDEERDRRLARHILSAHRGDESALAPEVDLELLKKFVAYARRNVRPKLSEEAVRAIEDYFVSVRRSAKENSAIPITARQLEAIVRLAEASARMRLSDTVTAEDAKRAIDLVGKCLREVAIDPETGQVDIDIVMTGTPKSQRYRISIMRRIIEELENTHEKGAPEEEILRMAEEEGIDPQKAKEILGKMLEMGDIYRPRYGYYRMATR